MASEATMKSSPLETIKVIPFWGNDKTKGGMEPREFFKKAEVFAASKGFERGLLEKLKLPSPGAVELTREEEQAQKWNNDARNFLIMSCQGDAFAIIEAEETANDMWKALKSRYDSKKTKDLVKATTQLEKCYMKNDMEDPHMWILELERLNREVGKCENGTMRSQEQMQATILARLPKRRYEAVITSLNGKIGREGMDHQDFVEEITGHYQMFIEPFKGRIQEKRDEKGGERNQKHLALTTTGGRNSWRQFKGKCNKCGKQGHKARDCKSNEERNGGNVKNGNGVQNSFSGKCYKCGQVGHRAQHCKTQGNDSGMFVGMAIHETRNREEPMVQNDIDLDKLALEILNDIANDNRKRKPDTELDRKYKKFAETIIALDVSEPEEELIGQYYDGIEKNDTELEEDLRRIKKPVSWADMCETSDDESNHEDNDDDDEDDFWNDDEKDKKKESDTTEYRMDTPRGLSNWKWDEEVFMANSSKTKFVADHDEDGFENWLMDSGATTHVAKTTNNMFNLKATLDGEHVRVGSNETLKATAIGDLCLEQNTPING
ncbi:hypothetical protein MHU86_5251 [Fragilaria crotonensis]|nr:hypothetical protein MHU86_5251 [Fragilaria crotonensis]